MDVRPEEVFVARLTSLPAPVVFKRRRRAAGARQSVAVGVDGGERDAVVCWGCLEYVWVPPLVLTFCTFCSLAWSAAFILIGEKH